MKRLFLGVMVVVGMIAAPVAAFASDIEVGAGSVVNTDSGKVEAEVFGKANVLDIGDKAGLSIRGSLNTAAELNLGGSLDYQVAEKTEIYVEGGYQFDLNDTTDEGAYVGPGITQQISDKLAINADAKYLFEREDVNIRVGLVYLLK
jgi:outer membrane autotransporter protein